MHVVVAVITYKRPKGLRRLLQSLAALQFEARPRRLVVLVVDNDPAGSAASVCDEVVPHAAFELRYYIEPQKGIPFARNRCIREAGSDFDYLAFVDDDEWVERTWLDTLLRVQREFEADVTTGPVLPAFEGAPPAWALAGRFYERPRRKTGTRCSVAFTNNILLSAAVFEKVTPWFDERLANTGGSDSEFLRRVERAGHSIVWADEALVHELVPDTRLSARWLCQRMYRVGNTLSRERFQYHRWPVALALTGLAALRWSAYATCMAPLGLFAGRHRWIDGARHVCYVGGLVAGAAGLRYDEYVKHHGT